MSRRRQLSDEERELWSGIARSVTPLRREERSNLSSPAGGKIARKPVPSKPAGVPAEPKLRATPPTKTPPLAPLGRRLKQRVARGREPIDARLDLHGMTQVQAHAALLGFLQRAQADGVRIALIVTGKGTGRRERDPATERGVLRRQVPNWLSLPEFRRLVVGFEDAHIGHGGEGALYVRLRRER